LNINRLTREKSVAYFPAYLERAHSDERLPGSPEVSRITPQWQLSLDALITELERLPAMTELRFLKVGAMLQEIAARLLTVGEAADMAAGRLSGEEAQGVIKDMELLLDRLEDDLLAADRSAGQISSLLGRILDELGVMEQLMENFTGHIGNLRMLKLLTNIQGASLTQGGMSFGNVATDIGTLSENIQIKSNAILTKGKSLNDYLAKGSVVVTGLVETQQKLSRTMVGSVRTEIAIMAEMHAKCSLAARDLSNRSGEISRNVSSIVVALQFQDITRQQMEHARDALVEVRKRLASERESANTGLLSDEMADICLLQAAQLANSADELVNAVTGIATGLQAVSREAADSSARVHGLFSQADSVERSSLADIELGLKSLLDAFAENMTVRERLADIIQATTLAMGEITGFAKEIDFVGSEIRLIALNAIIKAARAGKEGAAFGVIAENINKQSDEICCQVTTINTTIQTISRHVTDLRQGTPGQAGGSAVLRRDELATTTDRLKGLIYEAGELLLGTDHAADSLTETIAATTAALASRELIATVQKDLLPRIERLAGGMQSGFRKGLHGRRAEGVQDAELRYTMGSERAVHQELVGGGTPVSWNGSSVKNLLCAPVAGNAHFDNNVEFF